MNPGIERTCFYSSQLTLENKDLHASHIGSCSICNKKLRTLIEQEKAMRKHFVQYKIQPDIYEALVKDLVKVEKLLYPNTLQNVCNKTVAYIPVIKKNSLLFVQNIFKPKNVILALVAYLFYYFVAA